MSLKCVNDFVTVDLILVADNDCLDLLKAATGFDLTSTLLKVLMITGNLSQLSLRSSLNDI